MTDTDRSSRLRTFLLKTLADPVLLYTVLLMMSIMYHYRSSLALAYGVASYLIGWVVFRIFDFVNKHHIIGFFACIIMYIGAAWAAFQCMEIGLRNYPISWSLWFFTPQDALRYNKWYTVAIFILFLFFMLSVVYYFTRVRYRIFMNFLIFIIPFALYGKEYEKMPIGYIIALAIGYVLMMVTFRQLHESQKDIFIDKKEAWTSVAVFTVLFALFSTLFPKPVVHEDRTILETLINAEKLTDRLNQMLDVFRDTSTGDQFRKKATDTVHFTVKADMPMRLKTASFSTYSFENDSWKTSDIDTYYRTLQNPSFSIDFNREVADAVFFVAGMDSDFAKKYGLEEYAGKKLTYPDEREAVVTTHISIYGSETVPVPQGAIRLSNSSFKEQLALSRAASIFTVNQKFYEGETFSFDYVPSGALENNENKALVQVLAEKEDYSGLLKDAYDIIDDIWNPDEETAHYRDVLNVNSSFYDSYTETLLDYGSEKKISDLAQEIAKDCDTDYDKAKAIEWYFVTNGFIYDLDYQKSQDENINDFLFDTKTGVCVEYATAMTLLSRAAGIPARYCEGYLTNEELKDSKGDYKITGNEGHAFPELYIKGYGWMTFEPTMSNFLNASEKTAEKSTTTEMLKNAGFIMLIIAAVLLLLLIALPFLIHKAFILIYKRRKPDKAVSAVMHRLCRLYDIPATNTAGEAEKLIADTSGADISATKKLFSKLEYGNIPMSEDDRKKAMADYIAAYDALRESKKKKRKLRKSTQGGN